MNEHVSLSIIILVFGIGLVSASIGETLYLINFRRLKTGEAALYLLNSAVFGLFLFFIFGIGLALFAGGRLPYLGLTGRNFVEFALTGASFLGAFWFSRYWCAKSADPSGTRLTKSYIAISSLAFVVFVIGFWISGLEFYKTSLF